MADEELVRWLYVDTWGKRHAGYWDTLDRVAKDIAFYHMVTSYEEGFGNRDTVAVVTQSGVAVEDDVLDALIDAEEEAIERKWEEQARERREHPPVVTYFEWDGQRWEE